VNNSGFLQTKQQTTVTPQAFLPAPLVVHHPVMEWNLQSVYPLMRLRRVQEA